MQAGLLPPWVNRVEAIMFEHQFGFMAFRVKSYHASLLRSAVSNAIAVPTIFLFLMLDGSAFAQEIDPASAIRGSLGVSLAHLGVSNHFGVLSFILNGGFALLCGALAVFLVARSRRDSRTKCGRKPMSFKFPLLSKRAGTAGRQSGLAKRGLGG
jgi:hypothetical protein